MNSIQSALSHFFQLHQQHFFHHYPGLTKERFIEDYLYYKNKNKDEYFFDEHFLSQIKNAVPLAYIYKKKYFYNSDFYVDENVLIPRIETEILVYEALKLINQPKMKILEIGSGSGCISLAILREVKVEVELTLSDISQQALNISKLNYFQKYFNFKQHQVSFVETDRLKGINGKFDLILSNPPYIPDDSQTVHPQVDQFEPHLALYLQKSDYDQWFKDFFAQVEDHLNPGGYFLMEGHEDHLERISTYFSKGNIEILNDLTGRKRFIKLRL